MREHMPLPTVGYDLAVRLTPGLAKELFGKLSFCLQSLFCRVGRARALPLLKRCYAAPTPPSTMSPRRCASSST